MLMCTRRMYKYLDEYFIIEKFKLLLLVITTAMCNNMSTKLRGDNLLINLNSTITHWKALFFCLLHPTWKRLQPILFVTVYCIPGPYFEVLSEFSGFLSSLVLKTD